MSPAASPANSGSYGPRPSRRKPFKADAPENTASRIHAISPFTATSRRASTIARHISGDHRCVDLLRFIRVMAALQERLGSREESNSIHA